MNEKDIKDFFTLIATFIVSFLFLSIPNVLIKTILMLIYLMIFIFVTRYINNKILKDKIIFCILIIIELIIFIFSIVNTGSITSYLQRITDLFFVENNEYKEYLLTTNNKLEDYFFKLNEQISEINNKIDNTDSNITKMDENLFSITSNLNLLYFNSNAKPETNEIIKLIKEHDNEDFEDLRNDRYLVELFYKMYISDKPYYYGDILEAFEKYGININKLNLDKNTLVVWDIEILYATYNFKQSNIYNLNSAEIIDKIYLEYNNYKVSTPEYRDTFDYGSWNRDYSRYTAKEIDDLLNTIIMQYCMKFMLNFSSQ